MVATLAKLTGFERPSPKEFDTALLLRGISAKPWQCATNRGFFNTNLGATTAAQVCRESRKRFGIRGRYSELRVIYSGLYTDLTGAELPCGNSQQIETALEMAGIVKRFTYGGSATGTIPSGQARYISDSLYPAEFGLAEFTDGDFFVRERRVVTAGQFITRHSSGRDYTGERTVQHTGVAASQLMNTGALTMPEGGSAIGVACSPVLIIGRPIGAPRSAWVTIGDSLAVGEDDAYFGSQSDGSDGAGAFGRACYQHNLPFAHFGWSGTRGAVFAAGFRGRREYLDYFHGAYVQYGTNDGAQSVTPAAMWAVLKIIYAALRAHGISWIIGGTIPVRTTSTDAWATTGNQTQVGLWPNFREPLNTLIRGNLGVARGGPDGLFDIDALVRSPAVPTVWTPGYTDDGTHPLQSTVANVLTPAFYRAIAEAVPSGY